MKTEDRKRARFIAAMTFLFPEEGGWANRPPHEDPGGPTKYGITIGALSKWYGRPATLADVKALTKAEAEAIYLRDYWNASRCDELPDGLDLCVFDLSVRGGPGRAAYILQEALNRRDVTGYDGVIGPKTIGEVRQQTKTLDDLKKLILRFCRIEDEWDDTLSNAPYNPGWETRVERKKAASLAQSSVAGSEAMANPVPPPPQKPIEETAIEHAEETPPKPVTSDPVVREAGKAGAVIVATETVRQTPEIISAWLPTLGNIGAFISQHKDVILYIGIAVALVFVGRIVWKRYVEHRDEPQKG